MATKLRRSNFHTNADNHVNESINAKLAANLGNISTGNITTTGYIAGPATFTIDPAAVGDNTGTLIVAGNLQVDGTTTTINSTTLEVDDLNITLASGAANATAANGAGITVDGASATITYASASDSWSFNKNVGIGTTSPSDTLEVSNNSNYQLRISSSGENYQIGRNGSDGLLYFYGNQSGYTGYVFSGVNGERMRIDSNGNVGIGTTNPWSQLDVSAGTGSAFTSLTADNNKTIYFRHSDGTLHSQIESQSTGSMWLTTRTSGSIIQFGINNSEQVRIDSSGRVLIGDSSPDSTTEKLVVSGNGNNRPVRFMYNGNSGTYFDIDTNDANGTVVLRADARSGAYPPMVFETSATERMRIASTGNVGIGTTTVTTKIDVNEAPAGGSGASNTNTIGAAFASLHGNTSGNDQAFAIRTTGQYLNGISGSAYSSQVYAPANNNALEVFTGGATPLVFGTSATERMRIASTGNVGIGTTSPNFALDVASEIGISEGNALAWHDGSGGRSFDMYASGADNSLRFRVTGSSEAMRIDSNGTLILKGPDDNSLQVYESGSEIARIGPNSGSLRFLVGSTSVPSMIINSGGVVNINTTTNTGGKLNVANGSGHWVATWVDAVENGLYFEFRDSGGNQHGSIQASGTGVIYNTTSDIRLKTNIAPITDATNKIMAMNAVTHKWKNDPDADSIHGFIAQEMRDIVPEAVSQGQEENDTWSMDYGRITPIIVAALQDALKEIDMLKNRITELEAK